MTEADESEPVLAQALSEYTASNPIALIGAYGQSEQTIGPTAVSELAAHQPVD